MAEIFRFVTVRSPGRVTRPDGRLPVALYALSGNTDLLGSLRNVFDAGGTRAEQAAIVEELWTRTRPLRSLSELPLPLDRLDAWLAVRREPIPIADAVDAITSALGSSPKEIRQGGDFRGSARLVADQLLASAIGGRRQASVPLLMQAARLLGFIDLISKNVAAFFTAQNLSSRPVLIPAVAVPWPVTTASKEAYKARWEAAHHQRSATADELEQIRRINAAVADLSAAIRAGGAAPTVVDAAAPPRARDLQVSRVVPNPNPPTVRVAEDTRAVVTELDIDLDRIGAIAAITELESAGDAVSDRIFSGDPSPSGVPIGSVTIDSGAFDLREKVDFSSSRIPGACPPSEPEVPTVAAPTVPSGVGVISGMGVADLMVTRQRLLGYEAGEIAHIENVLRSELRERVHRYLKKRDEQVIVETETTTEQTKDLATSDRFELQHEAESVLQDDTEREANASGGGSFGPFGGEASVHYARNTSRQDSERSATTFARDVTKRSTSRIQQRVLESRTTRTTTELEETNTHRFDNAAGADDIVGAYRWVDAVFEAQVLNYGRRLLLEVLVPDPAAFFRFALTESPRLDLRIGRPPEPGFCLLDSGQFMPLSPDDVTAANYLYFAGTYEASNVSPPPPRWHVASDTLELTFTPDAPEGHAKAQNDLSVPDGYLARRAWVAGTYLHKPGETLNIYCGRHYVRNGSTGLDGENGDIPVAVVSQNVVGFAFTVEVACERSPEAFRKWQLDTYDQIMAGYRLQLSNYEDALARARDDTSTLALSDAVANRTTMERELRRGAISTLSGQHFDAFDAMRKRVAPHGYPQADLAEAAAEGVFIQFFEEAFDWANMAYRFYPYYWTRKEDWPTLVTLRDSDPLFASFLAAGSARLRIPVQPGFESAVCHYFESGGNLPDSTDVPQLGNESAADDFHQALLDDLCSGPNESVLPGPGTIEVEMGSARVTGTGTEFAPEDVDREVRIGSSNYVIVSVDDATSIEIAPPYAGATDGRAAYVLGPRRVGTAWEVRVPTTLVTLRAEALSESDA